MVSDTTKIPHLYHFWYHDTKISCSSISGINVKLAQQGKKPQIKPNDQNDAVVLKAVKSAKNKDIEQQYFNKYDKSKNLEQQIRNHLEPFEKKSVNRDEQRKISIMKRALLEVSRWRNNRDEVMRGLGM